MEAKELRIGNYVMGETDPSERVTETTIEILAFIKLFKPIPLTEEWLLIFGFKNGVIKDNKVGVLEVKLNGYTWIGGEHSEHGYEPKEIKHVHQLQNLYFALTGNELALNG